MSSAVATANTSLVLPNSGGPRAASRVRSAAPSRNSSRTPSTRTPIQPIPEFSHRDALKSMKVFAFH